MLNFRKRSTYVFVMISAFITFFAILANVNANAIRNYVKGSKLPEFTLQPVAGGNPVTFTPGKGKPAAVIFFSVQPEFRKTRSIAMLTTILGMLPEYQDKVDIIPVYSDNIKDDEVLNVFKEGAAKFTLLDDSKRDVYNLYGIFMMPMVVLIDSQGMLHEVIPYSFDFKNIITGHLKLLLGTWSKDQFQASLDPSRSITRNDEEKAYIRKVNYGRVMVSKRMYSQAIREFTSAIKLNPNGKEAYAELGFVYITNKDWNNAETMFRQLLKIDSNSDDGLAGLGLVYYGKGLMDEALPHLNNAMIAETPQLEVIIALAEIYEKKGDMDKAVRFNKLAVSRLMTIYREKWLTP